MLTVGIIGGSGYTGGELLRLLAGHPQVQVTAVTSERSAGLPVLDHFPHLTGLEGLVFESLQPEIVFEKADFFFLALPHTQSMSTAAALIRRGKKVVDLSADFRLKNPEVYKQWYHAAHTHPELLGESVYGLSEFYHDPISKASLVANPGCFPTGALLGLLPLLKGALVQPEGIVIDAKSGVSGAGRIPKLDYHFPEVNESVQAYNVTSHRHRPEINQELSSCTDQPVQALFTPHLVPMTRGILTTIYARLKKPVEDLELIQGYESAYKKSPFVRVLPSGKWPSTGNVKGSNYCHIGVSTDPQSDYVIIVTAIDNLVKGASGQAIQNMNIMLGFDESSGLKEPALFP